ncbi:4'-phosphopantetheinyl transferase superfamily protein [Paenibacillus sp. PR3]|uniref:4'-phosphopantetheinyl transferase superfamily protein n=1 Tax=Paenibacillus terricola TaxID=2763503 RepID=A0ABR8MRS6_9BACL|nr:4'-phosphopantetheinyl transferase superfamily protein [Paenibacillus terricola]MBD3918618.1 4'-phosphopantetheinyl transferase superfamily protein [Paenibacillus terricola]
MLELFTVRIEPLPAYVIRRLLEQVSADRQRRYERFRIEADAVRSLFSELVVRRIVMERNGIHNDAIVFGANAHGKPKLVHPVGMHYNVSHSGDWVVCAISDEPVGIDIEQIKPIDMEISRRFFSAIEHEQLMELPEMERVNRFYELWALKESFVKAVGKGLSMPLDSFSFRFECDGVIQLRAPAPYERFSGCLLEIDEAYKLAVCSSKEQQMSKINTWSTIDWL